MEGKKRARIALYAMAGVYLLILAYNMFNNLANSVDENERIITIIFIVVFIVAGVAMVSLGLVDSYRAAKKAKEEYYAIPAENQDVEQVESEIEMDTKK